MITLQLPEDAGDEKRLKVSGQQSHNQLNSKEHTLLKNNAINVSTNNHDIPKQHSINIDSTTNYFQGENNINRN